MMTKRLEMLRILQENRIARSVERKYGKRQPRNRREGKYTGDCVACGLNLADFDGNQCPRCGAMQDAA